MIDTARIPANMTTGEYLIHLDEPRERPRRQLDYPPDHTRADWLRYENEWHARIRKIPTAKELILCLLVRTKRHPEAAEQLEGIWNVLLQSLAKNRDGKPPTEGAE